MNSNGNSIAAELLAVSASAYASCASNRLLEKRPEVEQQFGASAFDYWKDHFGQRIRELSAALAEQQPALFLSRVRWSRTAFLAREVPENLLQESLVCLAEVLHEELPETCRQAPQDYISAAVNSFETLAPASKELKPHDPESKLAMQYLLKILEGDCDEAIRLIIDAHDQGMTLAATYQALVTAQREIGRMWHEAEVNVSEEHLVTSTTLRAMSVLAYEADRQPFNGKTVVAAAVAGNVHDMGIRVVTDFFSFAGWRAICLGGDLPPAEIARAVNCFDASLVLLSAAMTTQLKAIRETIQAIREINKKCKVMIGGSALQDTPEIWQQLGADAYTATPSEAVKTGMELV
jgi:methanogenic corrinoid protein MtbC1